MTNDYKKSLIDYVTGLLSIEQEQPTDFDPNELAGTGVKIYTSTEWQFVIDALDGYIVSINGILENENYDNYIMYGGYQSGTNNSNGFLIYINEYGIPTKIRLLENARGFQFLKFDEINNRVYGVYGDRATNSTSSSNDAYFVYYNNLFLTEDDNNPPTISYSYKIHSDSGTDYFMVRDIVKHPERPFYLIYSTGFNSLSLPKATELRINVGQANELKTWSVASNYVGYAFYGSYTEETPHFKLILYDTRTPKMFRLGVDNGDNVSITNLTCDTTLKDRQNAYVINNYISIDEDTIYFVYNATFTENATQYRQSGLYKYDGTTEIKTIYNTDAIEYGTYHNIPILNVLRDINTIYCIRGISNEENTTTHISVVNISEHPTPQESDFITLQEYGSSYVYRFNMYNFRSVLKRNYNLIYFNCYTGYMREGLGNATEPVNGFSSQTGFVKQRIGYTGYPYSYYNVLVPRYVNLYYAGVALLFSRNVYNITKFNNTTTASVEVPARYLNNYEIGREKLFGVTGYELVRGNELISKNQYEVLHLNFLNTINVVDEDNNVYYDLGAIKINNGITTGTQQSYEDTRGIKYRVNYVDGTNVIGNTVWTDIDDTHKQTSFLIYVDKAIKDIDLISSDSSTIYLTINGTFIIDKNYMIKQKVRVE